MIDNSRRRTRHRLALRLLFGLAASFVVFVDAMLESAHGQRPATSSDLTRHVLTLGGESFELLLPPAYEIIAFGAAAESNEPAAVRFGIPRTRKVHYLEVMVADGPGPPSEDAAIRSLPLRSGYTLRYQLEPATGVGSGGTAPREGVSGAGRKETHLKAANTQTCDADRTRSSGNVRIERWEVQWIGV